MLSVVAVAMAGIAFVATQAEPPAEREVTTVAQPQPQPEPSTAARSRSSRSARRRRPRAEPAVQRGEVYVEVFNNSGITGLAGRTAAQRAGAGWQVVGSDNWYGTIPASTVYYPAAAQGRRARLLAMDLGIGRVLPAVDPMRLDRLTVILTADAA